MGYFQTLIIATRLKQVFTFRLHNFLKITHFTHVLSLNSLLKTPRNHQNIKKLRIYAQIARKWGPKPHILIHEAFLRVLRRVLHFLLFSYFWPLKSLYTMKTTHISLRKKSPSASLLKNGSKPTKNHFFSKIRKIQKKCSFFRYQPLKTANRPGNESR